MAVVTPSSRSLAMSSNQPPRTPPRAGQSGREDGQEMLTGSVGSTYPEARDTSIDSHFHTRHLRQAPSYKKPPKLDEYISKITKAGKSEIKMYRPAATAFTLLSKALYETLPEDLKTTLRERHKIPARVAGHLVFIDHHAHAPTHFPDNTLCPVNDAPDLIGVYNDSQYKKTKGVYQGVPHHCVEAIVEAKSQARGGGRAQAAAYAYRHQQARPDHPMVYCLIIKPQWYQVILSSPTGVVASPQTKWSDLTLLAAYIYSHYNPPTDHYLVDETITWTPGPTPAALPLWNIRFAGKLYTKGVFLFIGEPWRRRTTVFVSYDEEGRRVVVKETYFDGRRRWKEEDILTHIHAVGDVPGVVRLKGAECVTTGADNMAIQCRSSDGDTLREKKRLVFYDRGEHLLKVTSVNELLEAIYDAIEVHRTLLTHRKVLHRDMSLFNILIRPNCPKLDGRKVFESTPPFITDVLAGTTRPLESRIPKSLTIDADNAALLGQVGKELRHRTGTPVYVARSVRSGSLSVTPFNTLPVAMPSLSGEALRLYQSVHGQERYDRYDDDDGNLSHGGKSPNSHQLLRGNLSLPAFCHRPEHDVESIFWTLFVALLRVKPISAPSEAYASGSSLWIWNILQSHAIPEDPKKSQPDGRDAILVQPRENYRNCFFPEMHDVSDLLWEMSLQILPEYALWTGKLHDDHLHEAMQRLILQYLVDHLDNPIPLDPGHLRPTKPPPSEEQIALFAPSLSTKINSGSQRIQQLTASLNLDLGLGTRLEPSRSGTYAPVGDRKGRTPPALDTGELPWPNLGEGSSALQQRRPPTPRRDVIVASGSKRKSASYGTSAGKRQKGRSGSRVPTPDFESEEEQ